MRGSLTNTQLRELVMELKFQLNVKEAMLTAEVNKNIGLATCINKLEKENTVLRQNIPQNQ